MSAGKRFVLVGTGARGLGMFARPLLELDPDRAWLVALMDLNPLRLAAANRLLGASLPLFTDFQHMLAQVRPDGIIVATRDDAHADYVIRGLDAGLRVYCEKPLCIDAQQCRAIAQAAARSSGQGFVTHNARYNPDRTIIKEMVAQGRIGEIQHIEFRQNLDFAHGADYFRRWHKHKRYSGGLTIHKGSHHFDFLNWVVGSRPHCLRAEGGTYFYGKAGPFHGRRCRGCEHAHQCRFHGDMQSNDRLRTLYLEPEVADGYLRDGCVFDPSIDTEDYVNVHLQYENNVRVNYLLTAYASYEGNSVTLQGTAGRIEYHIMNLRRASESADPSLTRRRSLVVYDYWAGTAQSIVLPEPQPGGHGGSDPSLREDFFIRPWDAPRPDRMATLNEAIQAVLIGAAANQSMALNGEAVLVQNLLNDPCEASQAVHAP